MKYYRLAIEIYSRPWLVQVDGSNETSFVPSPRGFNVETGVPETNLSQGWTQISESEFADNLSTLLASTNIQLPIPA